MGLNFLETKPENLFLIHLLLMNKFKVGKGEEKKADLDSIYSKFQTNIIGTMACV